MVVPEAGDLGWGKRGTGDMLLSAVTLTSSNIDWDIYERSRDT